MESGLKLPNLLDREEEQREELLFFYSSPSLSASKSSSRFCLFPGEERRQMYFNVFTTHLGDKLQPNFAFCIFIIICCKHCKQF